MYEYVQYSRYLDTVDVYSEHHRLKTLTLLYIYGQSSAASLRVELTLHCSNGSIAIKGHAVCIT